MKKLYSIEGNSQKLDGGAMFGNVPKALWKKWVEVDELNRISLSCRSLLIKEENRNVLLELGVGAFFEPDMRQRFGIGESHHVLLDSLAEQGLSHEDIDVIVLSHLHFDHVGGLLAAWEQDKNETLLFPNAQILVSKTAWERAFKPHARDRASFIPPLMTLLKARPNVHLVEQDSHTILGEGYRFHFSHGHTPGMMLTEIDMPSGPVVFCADLIPGEAWVHLPVTMGYDRFAELVIDEKKDLLNELLARKGRLFFTHDCETSLGRIAKNEKGKFCLNNSQSRLISMEE